MTQNHIQTTDIPLSGGTAGQQLFVEPWGEAINLQAGCNYVLKISGPSEGSLEWCQDEGTLTVFAWPGCTFRVSDSFSEIMSQSENVVPNTPLETNTRIFLGLMLGKELVVRICRR